MKQYEAVIETLETLGGVATLGELNKEVFKIKDCEWKTKTPFASIRRIVQQTKGIYKIKPGLYGLEKYKKQLEDSGIIADTDKNKNSAEVCNCFIICRLLYPTKIRIKNSITDKSYKNFPHSMSYQLFISSIDKTQFYY